MRSNKNYWHTYKNYITRKDNPTPLPYILTLNVEIKKGQTTGIVHIPNTFNIIDHSIDLNPSLIRKKDKKIIKTYKPGEKISFNPNDYEVKLTKDEEKEGYILTELQRCDHCKQKVVIAELAETTVRTDPVIKVRLGDKATCDLNVPVKIGLQKSDIQPSYIYLIGIISAAGFGTKLILTPPYTTLGIIIGTAGLIWAYAYLIPRVAYHFYETWKFWQKYKNCLTTNPLYKP